MVAQNTLDTARKEAALKEEALFNDKINAAAKDLAARRQVTEPAEQDGKQTFVTKWEDDLVTRAAAIDRLEGLAIDAINQADYPPARRIARMLSNYLNELSKENEAIHPPHNACKDSMWEWGENLRSQPRPDMERAVQSLGRINPEDEAARAIFKPKNIYLRRCNLQGFDLRGGCLIGAQFREVQLDAADLERTQLQHAAFSMADLREVDLRKAQLQGAMLFKVTMSEGTLTEDCNLQGAAVFFVDEETINKLHPHWDNIIAFLEKLPPNAPSHWHEISEDFVREWAEDRWREWAASITPPVTIFIDYRDKVSD